MKKRDVLKLNEAVMLFNYASVILDKVVAVVTKMIKTKTQLEDIADGTHKTLKTTRESLKPQELTSCKEELKKMLAEATPDDKKIEYLRLRIALLQEEWDTKFRVAETAILDEEVPASLKLEKITIDELMTLLKEKSEAIDMGENRRENVVVNNVSTEHLAVLSHLIK